MFHLGVYWLSAFNALCIDEGSVSVTDRDECRLTMPYVRKEYPNAADLISYEYPTSELPPGCLFYNDAPPVVYFNSHESGGRNDYSRQICKGNGK